MCHPKICDKCSKITWTGCGKHVADVQASIPANQWCPGHDDPTNDSWLRRILGR
jgi:hypothetical protein